MGHTAWAPEGREGRYQAGPKGRNLEVGARMAPRLLVQIYLQIGKTYKLSKTVILRDTFSTNQDSWQDMPLHIFFR